MSALPDEGQHSRMVMADDLVRMEYTPNFYNLHPATRKAGDRNRHRLCRIASFYLETPNEPEGMHRKSGC